MIVAPSIAKLIPVCLAWFTLDTLFEIGGQDSKYISLVNANPLDFDMNKVCAAGTGSFLPG